MSDLNKQPDDRFSLQPDSALVSHLPSEIVAAEVPETTAESPTEQPPVFWVLLRELVETVCAFADYLLANPAGGAELSYRKPLDGAKFLR